jgi:2'-5' RNA ligase
MKVTFALLLDHHVHNVMRRMALELHRDLKLGLRATELPPHVSLKQSFRLKDSDFPALEAYFDEFASQVAPVPLILTNLELWRIPAGEQETAVMFLDVAQYDALRILHNRMNLELSMRFEGTRSAFDGNEYHFHATVAMETVSKAVGDTLERGYAGRQFFLHTTASHVALFYHDGDVSTTYKILPLGKK